MRTNASFAAPMLGLLTAACFLAGLSALPSCSSSPVTGKPDGGTTGSGGASADAGADGSGGGATVFISPDKCKLVGAANEVKADDPSAQGQCLFLLDAWGTEELDEWPPTDFMLGLIQSEPAVFGNQFASFGFLADPHDDLPIGFKRGLGNPAKVHETCAMCHTGKLPDGRLWFGAPNGKLDVGRFQVEVNKRWVAAGHAPLFSALSETKAAGLGPGRFNAESSDYPFVVAADFPPYFTLDKRTHMNYLGTGANVRTEAFFAIYSFGAGSPNDKTAKVPFPADDRLDAFLGFFGAFASPGGPAQDAALVAQGKGVYAAAKCGTCHHTGDIGLDGVVTYDKDPAGKERLPGDDPAFPNGSIRTDILHRVLIDSSVGPDAGTSGGGDAGMDNGYADLIAFIIEHHLSVGQTDGYRTSDLHGLWATAPYLHNGSVPTLDDLLKKAPARPVSWMRDGFLVDTTALGSSNQGHEFGTDLSDADKAALVAYLKSL
jgi:mono/diheme cytochrome c family protein